MSMEELSDSVMNSNRIHTWNGTKPLADEFERMATEKEGDPRYIMRCRACFPAGRSFAGTTMAFCIPSR